MLIYYYELSVWGFKFFLLLYQIIVFFFIEMQKIQILSFSKHLALPANLSGRATSDHYINYILLLWVKLILQVFIRIANLLLFLFIANENVIFHELSVLYYM